MSANFPPVGSSRNGGLGGLALHSLPSRILKACEQVGPVFMLFRSEACIFGTVANPLWFRETADVHLAASGALTLNLVPSCPCAIYNYLEAGPGGGFIDALEFTTGDRVGFLKLCRMKETNRERWMAMLAEFHSHCVDREWIAGIRKTNHLYPIIAQDREPSPAETTLMRFFDLVIDAGALLHVTSQVPVARSRLAFRPTHRVDAGNWLVLSAKCTGMHLAPSQITELRVVIRPHVALVVLLGNQGRLIARILTRDPRVLKLLPSIL